MRIINDNIELYRGETPTYSVEVLNKNDGLSPYAVPDVDNLHVEFSVKSSVFDKTSVITYYVPIVIPHRNPFVKDSEHVFPNESSVPDPSDKEIYYFTESDEYMYYDAGEWKEYKFEINIPFSYKDTSKFEIKTYKYQVWLIGGTTLIHDVKDGECPIKGITYNVPLNDPHDFVVSGGTNRE